MEKFHKRVPKKQRFLILSEHFDSGLSISELSRKDWFILDNIDEYKDSKLKHIFRYPKELLKILHWTVDETIYFEKTTLTEILNKIREENPKIEENTDYQSLMELAGL